LPDGEHNVTIYAQDEYGLISAPSTVYFNVKVFPTLTVTAVSVALASVIVAIGSLVYFKKYRNKPES
jgi:hypothetical protein